MSRLRFLACALAVLLVFQLLPGLQQPAGAAVARSAGGAASAPTQLTGTAAGRLGRVPTSATDKHLGGTVTSPAVRGAVPPQTKYSSPVLPAKPKPAPQHAGAMTEKAPPSTGMTAASREVPGARTSRQTEFANPDGTHTLRFYAGTANVRDQSSGAMVSPGLATETERQPFGASRFRRHDQFWHHWHRSVVGDGDHRVHLGGFRRRRRRSCAGV